MKEFKVSEWDTIEMAARGYYDAKNERQQNIFKGDTVYVNCDTNVNRYSLHSVAGHNCEVIHVEKRFVQVLAPDKSFSTWVSIDCIETYQENQ